MLQLLIPCPEVYVNTFWSGNSGGCGMPVFDQMPHPAPLLAVFNRTQRWLEGLPSERTASAFWRKNGERFAILFRDGASFWFGFGRRQLVSDSEE